ncbi:MAG TPA: SDR family oxidoreductase [Elusimicrobiota bacterium]|nr:SDR family oxidoreductase [Elusimicrobiota bacterium]
MRILVTGASGLIGRPLARRLASAGHRVWGTYASASEANPGVELRRMRLETPGEGAALARELAPEAVLHAAANASPDACEKDPAMARRVNAEASRELAAACAQMGARFVFLSTEQIFDGKNAPYREEAAPSPLSAYGKSKAEAEYLCRAACPRSLMVRVSLTFGFKEAGAPSFTDSMLASLRRGEKLKAFSDQRRAMLWVGDAVELLARALERPDIDAAFPNRVANLAGLEGVTRQRFAEALCDAFGLSRSLVIPGTTADAKLSAPRPLDCTLDGSRLWQATGHRPKSVEKSLAELAKDGIRRWIRSQGGTS